MNLHKMTSKIDMDTLDEIIAALEGKMTEPGEGRPFKKKAAVVMDMTPDEDESMEMKDEGEGEDDLDDADLDELRELYSKLKG